MYHAPSMHCFEYCGNFVRSVWCALCMLLQVVLQAVDALVSANADNVLRAGYVKVGSRSIQ
jgi:hypothetical protein